MSSFTFVVEPIEASKTYQGDKRRHREPSRSPSLDGAWRTMIPTDKGMIESMSPAPNGTVEVFTRQNLFAKAVHAARAMVDHVPCVGVQRFVLRLVLFL